MNSAISSNSNFNPVIKMDKKTDTETFEERIERLEKMVRVLQEKEALLHEKNDKLEKIKKYYDALMQNTEDYVLICDREGMPEAFNESYKKRTARILRQNFILSGMDNM